MLLVVALLIAVGLAGVILGIRELTIAAAVILVALGGWALVSWVLGP